MMKFVVIGGDAAGMSAASRAKRNWPDLEITVLEKTMDVSYSACGMPYNIADPKRPIDDLVVRPADVFRKKQGIKVLTGHLGEKIDRQRQNVHVISQDGSSFKSLMTNCSLLRELIRFYLTCPVLICRESWH
jgi:CoA-dependent NAD(P)H sulfur oxidoreductase